MSIACKDLTNKDATEDLQGHPNYIRQKIKKTQLGVFV